MSIVTWFVVVRPNQTGEEEWEDYWNLKRRIDRLKIDLVSRARRKGFGMMSNKTNGEILQIHGVTKKTEKKEASVREESYTLQEVKEALEERKIENYNIYKAKNMWRELEEGED